MGFKLGHASIYKKSNSSIYEKIQDFYDSIDDIEGVSISEDDEIVAFGDWDRKVFIYRRSGNLFFLNQTISTGFMVNHVKITATDLGIAGKSAKILFYKNNGT